MNLLCIDTTGPTLVLALVDPRGMVRGHVVDTAGKHAEVLLPGVAALLDGAGLTARDVDAVGVTLGPGGFTSVRVGLATAKGLCVAGGRALYAVSSLRALAHVGLRSLGSASTGGHGATGCIAVVTPAYRGEVYAALYTLGAPDEGGTHDERGAHGVATPHAGCVLVERVTPLHASPADALDALTRAANDQPSGVRILLGAAHLERIGGAELDARARATWSPCAEDALSPDALAAALQMEVAAGRARDVATLGPEYLRPPDAALPRS